tara:strand:- start:141 stop:425 length:285 start_codon:yes stop_codon:yes gene_type:complete
LDAHPDRRQSTYSPSRVVHIETPQNLPVVQQDYLSNVVSIEKPVYRDKIVLVERIVHKPVPNYITIRVKRPKKIIQQHVEYGNQVLKQGPPIKV